MTACVIFNPVAGRARARRRLAEFFRRHFAAPGFACWPTEFAGHGVALARTAAAEFPLVVAAGGDGTVHDVANGLLTHDGQRPALAVLPAGSANDYAYSIARQFDTQPLLEGAGHALDVGRVVAPGGRSCWFVESLGVCLSGLVTLEAQRISRLQGLLLYGLAAWRALARFNRPQPLELAWDGAAFEEQPTLYLSVLLGRREGSFLLAPGALLDDGLFDFVHAGDIGRWRALTMLPGLAWRGPPKDHPRVRLGRCRTLAIRSKLPLVIHVDGEMFARPEDGIHEIAIELHLGMLRAKVCRLDG
jgi:diacylglycerol kinase family enzyme